MLSRLGRALVIALLLLGACSSDDDGDDGPADSGDLPEGEGEVGEVGGEDPDDGDPGAASPDDLDLGAADCPAEIAAANGISVDDLNSLVGSAEDSEPSAGDQAIIDSFYACLGGGTATTGGGGATGDLTACYAEVADALGVSADEVQALLDEAETGNAEEASEAIDVLADCLETADAGGDEGE